MNRVVFFVGRRGPGLKLFPVILALALIVFGLLTFLVVLQDRTIDAQRDVIHLLYKERGRPQVKPSAGQVHTSQAARIQAPVSQAPSSQVQSNKVPSDQVQAQTPSSQAQSSQVQLSEKAADSSSQQKKGAAKPSHSARKSHKAPLPPPAEITDPSDMRRVSISI